MSDKERNFTCDLHCKGAVTPMCAQVEAHVPIHLKMTLTIKEAAEYSSIGINKIDAMDFNLLIMFGDLCYSVPIQLALLFECGS